MTTATVTYPMNVTYNGVSADLSLPVDADTELTDEFIRNTAEEMIRAGAAGTLRISDLPEGALSNFVIDRFDEHGALRLVVRPQTPFGGVA